MTYNRDDRNDLRWRHGQGADDSNGLVVAGALVAVMLAIGVVVWAFTGDTNVARDGAPQPSVTVQSTPPTAPSTTGSGTGTNRAPGSGQ